MDLKWIPLGEFEFEGGDLVFKGRVTELEIAGELKKQALVGQAISNLVFNGGTISVDVRFSPSEPQEGTRESYPYIAEIIVYKSLTTGDMVTAGLGGAYFLYSARVWDDKTQKWIGTPIKGGYIGQLKIDTTHTISVKVQSSQITLSIDGVTLGSETLPFPLVGSQVGVFCQSAADVRLSNFRIEEQQPKVFVVMPFSSPYNELYDHVFYPVCKRCELDVHRSDRTYGPGLIIADIVQRIMQSQVIVAEITPNPPNPNVYFEVGFALAMRKPIILIADRSCPERLPFDISPFRVMFYENTIAGKLEFQIELLRHLNAIIPGYAPILRYHDHLSRD